jgi:membrane protein DedA with SNARE-associated domain
MPKRYFFAYTALGSIGFCYGLAGIGEAAGHNIDAITAAIHDFAIGIVVVLVLALGAGIAWWRSARSRKPPAPGPAPDSDRAF